MLESYINLPLFSHSSMFHFTMYNSFAFITCYVPNFSFVSHMLFTLKSQISNKGKTIQVFLKKLSKGSRSFPMLWKWSELDHEGAPGCGHMLLSVEDNDVFGGYQIAPLPAMWDDVGKTREEDCLREINI